MLKFFAIFILQIIYVPLFTLRISFSIKGKKQISALVALGEAVVYIVSLGIVFSDLTNPLNIAAYIIGYSVGIYLGGCVEEKLALGYRTLQVSLKSQNKELIAILREKHFGVTTFVGEGMNNEPRYRLEIVSHRCRENELIDLIKEIDPTAFIVSYEPTQFVGGYIIKQLKHR